MSTTLQASGRWRESGTASGETALDESAFAAVLELIALALGIVDRDARVRHANAAATALLHRSDGLAVTNGRLRATHASVNGGSVVRWVRTAHPTLLKQQPVENAI
jgi:hypothetical protein